MSNLEAIGFRGRIAWRSFARAEYGARVGSFFARFFAAVNLRFRGRHSTSAGPGCGLNWFASFTVSKVCPNVDLDLDIVYFGITLEVVFVAIISLQCL